jgi:hypothetical protein
MGVEKYMFLVVQRYIVKDPTLFPGVHLLWAGYHSNHPFAGLLPGNSFFLIRTNISRYVEGIPELWAIATSLPRSKTRLSRVGIMDAAEKLCYRQDPLSGRF